MPSFLTFFCAFFHVFFYSITLQLTVAITGATGFIGKRLVEKLLEGD